MSAEAEHGEGDERVGRFEAEADSGDESDLGIYGFDAAVGEAVFDRGKDRGAVLDDRFLQFHERGNPAPSGPPHPLVEGLGGLVVRQFEDHPEAFLEVVGPAQSRVGLHDPGELDLLFLG